MLASTVQFSTYDQTPITRPHQPRHTLGCRQRYEMQTGPDKRRNGCPLSQDPTACLQPPQPGTTPLHAHPTIRRPRHAVLGAGTKPAAELVSVPPSSTTPEAPRPPENGRPSCPGRGSAPASSKLAGDVLLRKEVIQPHLPVRLPCYDFVPIADPAFDGSLHKGWATGFGRYRLS